MKTKLLKRLRREADEAINMPLSYISESGYYRHMHKYFIRKREAYILRRVAELKQKRK